MGHSTSYSEKCPAERDKSKATNAGFAKSSRSNVHAGSTVTNGGGKSYKGDVRKGGGMGGKASSSY